MGSEQNDGSESAGREPDAAANGPDERESDGESADHESARQDADGDLADGETGQEPDDGPADEDMEASSTDSAEPSAVTDDEQTWGVLIHISALSGLAVPFGNILAPLLLWLVKKDESEFVDASGKEAMNFQLTWTLLLLGASLTILIGVGLLVVPVIAVAWLVLVVLATIRASEKEVYDYPLTIDFID